VLIVTSWHLRRGDLWSLKPMKNRPLVILDEDALSALAAPVELTVERLRNFIENLQVLRGILGDGRTDTYDAWRIRRAIKPLEGDEAALALTDIFRRTAENILRACATAGRGKWSPADIVTDQLLYDYDRVLLNDLDAFMTLVRCAYAAARRKTTLPNMMADLRELLVEPRPVYLSPGACRWTQASAIPHDRQVIMLDATAQPLVVEGVLGRPADIIDTLPVEQQAVVYQVMDKIGTRAGNRTDLANDESWTVKLATDVAQRHRGQTLLCVTFKNDVDRLREILDREHGNATVIHYGALRGLNTFQDYKVGLLIGRPMPNEAQLQLLAVAAFGREALDKNLRPPPLEWQLHTHDIGPDTWQVRRQQYTDPRWQAIWRHVVTGELMQAIGRLRPLTNPATIYVATNEPLPTTLDVTAVYAAELFPAMSAAGKRSDLQQRVRQYAEAIRELEVADADPPGTKPTNRAVCRKLGIKECNGFRYRKLALALIGPP